jgi:hypothetical protein
MDKESYRIACQELDNNSGNFVSWRRLDDSRTLYVLENFEPTIGKIKSFYKIIKSFTEAATGKEIKFKACRTRCFAKNEQGNLIPLEDIL